MRGVALAGVLALLALAAFPYAETVMFGRQARHEAWDVFDDELARLGAASVVRSDGAVNLWSPYLTAGNTRLAQFFGTPFALDELFTAWVSPFRAYMLRSYLVVWFAGISLYCFLRRSVHLPFDAALVGAVIYLFSFWHYSHGFSAALLPLVLWLSDAAQEDAGHRRGVLALAGLLGGFLFYNANSQATIWTSALHLAYAGVVSKDRSQFLSRVRFWAATWTIALGLYAPVAFTQLQMIPLSVRAIRDDRAFTPNLWAALATTFDQYSTLLLSWPVAKSVGLRGPAESSYGTWYVGPVATAIIALSIGLPRRSRREKALGILLLAIPIADLIAMSLMFALERQLGLLRSFQFVRIRLFLPFALSSTAAVAYACLRRAPAGAVAWIRRRRWVILGLAVLFAAQAGLAARVAVYLARRLGPASFMQPRVAVWLGAVVYFAVGALAASALWVILRRPGGGATRWSARWVPLALILALVLDRASYARLERWIHSERLASYDEGLGATPAIKYLESQPNAAGYRVLTVADRTKPSWQSDNPNRLAFHGLQCADGYENIYPLAYHDFMGLVTKPHLDRDPAARAEFLSWGEKAYAWGPELNLNLASLAGVRWICAQRVSLDDPRLQVVFRSGDETVYENPGVLPRAFVALGEKRFRFERDLEQALSAASLSQLRDSAYDLDEGAARSVDEPTPQTPAVATVTRRPGRSDDLVFEVASPRAGVLVVTDTFAPGWVGFVNGHEERVFPVDEAFRGIRLPAGREVVEMVYRPKTAFWGFLVSAVALTVLALIGVSQILVRHSPVPRLR